MTISEWVPVVLFILGFMEFVLVGLAVWALTRLVSHGEEIARMKAEIAALQNEVDSHKDDAEKKFDELKEYIGKLFKKIDDMNATIGQALLHRRGTDKSGE
jgi:chromosome segregation ATPase